MHAEDIAVILRGRRAAVLTGAGCSTESGIPDYRGPKTRDKARNPIKFMEFVKTPEARRRYWARSVVGWPRMRAAKPNAAHAALAQLESRGVVRGVITQNVDRLHHGAGSREVIELHGALADVRCLECGHVEDRDSLQARLLGLNPGFKGRAVELAPDGDAVIDPALVDGCLQLALIWGLGVTKSQTLPLRIAELKLYAEAPFTGPLHCTLVGTSHTAQKTVSDIQVTDARGAVVLELFGVEMYAVPGGA